MAIIPAAQQFLLIARHLLVICCNGGTPYVDLHHHLFSSTSIDFRHQLLDPTDWIASDTIGDMLNATIHPDLLIAHPELAQLIADDIELHQCDLFNLTFTSVSDQELFDRANGQLSCRCPNKYWGHACQLAPAAAASIANNLDDDGVTAEKRRGSHRRSIVAWLVLAVASLVGIVLLVAMRGGSSSASAFLCDCFGQPCGGGSSSRQRRRQCCTSTDDDDDELDQNTINRCLEAVRKHEIEQQQRIHGAGGGQSSQIYHPPPTAPLLANHQQSTSECTAAPVDYPTANHHHRTIIDRSPPPSYRSTPATSMERLSDAHRSCTTRI